MQKTNLKAAPAKPGFHNFALLTLNFKSSKPIRHPKQPSNSVISALKMQYALEKFSLPRR
jgi:hypothetical protein